MGLGLCVWSGRPYWVAHASALGQPLYASIKATWNCANIYNVGSSGSGVHVAFMGDPTLRVFPISNIQGLKATSDCTGKGVLIWNRPNDQPDSIWVDEWQNNKWNRIIVVSGRDTALAQMFPEGLHQFSVRSKKLMKSASGSWWDVGARSEVKLSVNKSDTIKLVSNAMLKCSGDTFVVRGLHKKHQKRVEWALNYQTVNSQDSVIQVASVGQGKIKIALLTETDSGCVSADSLVLFSVPSNELKWNGKTDSTIQVKSTLPLPIRWYRNDTLIAGESDTILKITKSGIYRAETLAYELCLVTTDTLTIIWKPKENRVDAIAAEKSMIRIYPNPTTTGFWIVGPMQTSKYTWILCDPLGAELLRGNGSWVDVSALKSGCYILKLRDQGSYIIIKQ
jgi:hypothetical protein